MVKDIRKSSQKFISRRHDYCWHFQINPLSTQLDYIQLLTPLILHSTNEFLLTITEDISKYARQTQKINN